VAEAKGNLYHRYISSAHLVKRGPGRRGEVKVRKKPSNVAENHEGAAVILGRKGREAQPLHDCLQRGEKGGNDVASSFVGEIGSRRRGDRGEVGGTWDEKEGGKYRAKAPNRGDGKRPSKSNI